MDMTGAATRGTRTRAQMMIDIQKIRQEIKRLEKREAELKEKMDEKVEQIPYRCYRSDA